MLSYEKALEIGKSACIEKLGREFVERYAGSSSFAHGRDEEEPLVYCFIGVDNNPKDDGKLILTSDNDFPYRVSCSVNMINAAVTYLECVLPKCSV